MKRQISLLWLAVTTMGLLFMLAQYHDAKEHDPAYLLRYGENQPSDYPTTQSARYFADLVRERTSGDVLIEVYSDSALGDESSIIRQLQFGGVDFARVSTSLLIEYSDKIGVLSLPYLFRDEVHMRKVIESEIGDSLLEEIGSSGLIGLSWYDAGERNFYTRDKKVETLEDLKGLSIRVQTAPYMEEMVRALGANPVSLPYDLVYSNLSTGKIDGAENNWPSYEGMQHYRIAKYILLDGHTRIPEMQIMSSKTAALLPDEYMTIIEECAKESAVYERQLWQEREEVSIQRAAAGGVTITRLSAEEQEKFRIACQPLYERYAALYTELVEQIIAME